MRRATRYARAPGTACVTCRRHESGPIRFTAARMVDTPRRLSKDATGAHAATLPFRAHDDDLFTKGKLSGRPHQEGSNCCNWQGLSTVLMPLTGLAPASPYFGLRAMGRLSFPK